MNNDLLINLNYTKKDIVLDFFCTDQKDLFEQNKKKFGNEWKYYDMPISYNMNAAGYRMNKNFNEIDYDNYIIFFGCSHTIGVGLPLEDTFAYRIAKQVKCDYINASIHSSGTDFVYANFLHFFGRMPKKPKCIVFVWPELTSKFYWLNNNIEFYMSNPKNYDSSSFWNKAYEVFLLEESNIKNTFNNIRLAIEHMCNLKEIPYLETTSNWQTLKNFNEWFSDIEIINNYYDSSLIEPKNLHYLVGRDVIRYNEFIAEAHFGLLFQNAMIEKFFLKMGNLFDD